MVNLLIGVVVVALFGGVWYASQSNNAPSVATSEMLKVSDTGAAEMEGKPDEMMDEETAMNSGATTISPPKPEMSSTNSANTMADDMSDTPKSVAMMGDDTMKKDMPASAATGSYTTYSAAAVAAAATAGDAVLFFYASWCPSCRTLEGDIKNQLTSIPAGLTIFNVDYDTSTALKQKYGVTTQHTLVQVSADGTLIKKWSGGSTLASVVAQVE